MPDSDAIAAQNISVVRQMFEAVAARGSHSDPAERWRAYAALYDEQAVIHEAPSLPYGGTYSGMEGIAAHAKAYGSTWGELQTADLRDLTPTFVADAEHVVVLWRQRGVNPRSGESFDMPAVSAYRMKDSRVLESRMSHFDSAAVVGFLQRAAPES